MIAFDFANQDRIIRGRMPTLEIINDHFSRLFRNTLSSALRKAVDVGSRGVQMMKFGEFIKTLPVPSSLHIFRMDPLRGHAILVLESKLVFTLLDIFFGGSGKNELSHRGTGFYRDRIRLIQRVVAMVFGDLEKAWNSVHPLTIQHTRSEINPQFVSIVPPSDLVMTIPFGIELEQFTRDDHPLHPLLHHRADQGEALLRISERSMEVDRNWIERFYERLKNTEVEVKVELGRGQITVQDLFRLKVGDVIPMGKDVSDPLSVQVQGVPKFLARPGVYGSNKAIQIEEKIKPETSERRDGEAMEQDHQT